jgi:hypothetical protein
MQIMPLLLAGKAPEPWQTAQPKGHPHIHWQQGRSTSRVHRIQTQEAGIGPLFHSLLLDNMQNKQKVLKAAIQFSLLFSVNLGVLQWL